MTAFWDVAPCSLHHRKMMEGVRTSETSFYFNETTWHRRYIPESCNLRNSCRENLKSYNNQADITIRILWHIRNWLTFGSVPLWYVLYITHPSYSIKHWKLKKNCGYSSRDETMRFAYVTSLRLYYASQKYYLRQRATKYCRWEMFIVWAVYACLPATRPTPLINIPLTSNGRGPTFQRCVLPPLSGRSPWWWRPYSPLKRQSTSTWLHGATSQKTLNFI
jgi:hypothetical protein